MNTIIHGDIETKAPKNLRYATDPWSAVGLRSGSWNLFGVPLPDIGISEAYAETTGAPKTEQGGSDVFSNTGLTDTKTNTTMKVPDVKGAAVTINPNQPGLTQNQPAVKGATDQKATTTTKPQDQSEVDKARQQLSDMQSGKIPWDDNLKSKLNSIIEGAGKSSEDAARAAAEARRQAALRAYEGKKMAAGVAKEAAKGQYDWLVDTLGTNKKDLLDQVALNEKTGVQEYERQSGQTQENYDKSRKEILSTYRDLAKEQEKILRGAGVASSSRSTEAQLRLNNLLGKDLSEVSTSEADAMAQIGNATAAFKEKVVLTKNSIENEANSQQAKATLDYNNQIKAIDANLQLSANEREDAYAAADAQLAADTAEIAKWTAGLKLQVQTTIAQQASKLDDFVVDMTDSQKLLGADLATKKAATDAFVQDISTSMTLDKEGNLVNPSAGVKQKKSIKSLEELYDPTKVASTAPGGGAGTPGQGTVQNISAKQDPLLAALYA